MPLEQAIQSSVAVTRGYDDPRSINVFKSRRPLLDSISLLQHAGFNK